MTSRITRRGILQSAAALTAVGSLAAATTSRGDEPDPSAAKGRLKQSVCRWCYGGVSLDDLCVAAKKLGLVGIDLLGPNDFETIKKHDLICTMISAGNLGNGFCDPKYHESSIKASLEGIEIAQKAGYPNVICFSGNARGIDRETGLKNAVKGLKEVVPVAEKAGVTLILELLNSKVDHHDYMCDHSDWGVEVCKQVGSKNLKLLYDIYHMQIMEGDVIRTIEKNHEYFGHYHTGGNPGRNEIDQTQELNYHAIAKAIADTGYKGFVAHEFLPKRDPLKSLAEAVAICTV